MSPILVRPVREQLEHDRLIRLLQVKLKRKFDAAINPGNEQNAAVGTGPTAVYPDLVLMSPERGRRLQGVIEVETGESVNHLEALAQWTHLGRLRAEFQLYVPAGMVDVARRLCEDNQIQVNEIWSFHSVGDQVRFTLVHRSKETAQPKRPALPTPAPKPVPKLAPKPTPTPAPVRTAKSPVRSAPKAKAKKATKPKKAARKPARAQKRK